jgi:hypothetical protein
VLLSPRAQEGVGALLKVWAGMGILKKPSPLQAAPGMAGIRHLLQHAVRIIAGGIALSGHIDEAELMAIDLT